MHVPRYLLAVVILTALILPASGIEAAYWPCALCVAVLLTLAAWSFASACLDVARWLFAAGRHVRKAVR